MKNQGLPDHVFDGRPVIGICNTWSEITPCNAHLRELLNTSSVGVGDGRSTTRISGYFTGETQMRPTAMLFRNHLSMSVEEVIRANPIDGVVLLGGCDKTTPDKLWAPAVSIYRPSSSLLTDAQW